MHILHVLYINCSYTFISLFSIVNPIGMSAVFLSMTKQYPVAQRRRVARKVAQYSMGMIVATFFIGSYILNFFGISLASLQVAGGLLVFTTAWQIMNSAPHSDNEQNNSNETIESKTFFPLTMPITAGAGSIAVTIALSAHIHQTDQAYVLFSLIGALIGILAVCITVWFCYAYSDEIFAMLGATGTNMVTKITSFILLAISIEIIWGGIRSFILSIH